MRAQKVINFVVDTLEEKLPSGLVYHLVDHTLDVIEAASRLSKLEGLDEAEQELVMVAAALHDLGYTVKYRFNEETAAELAKEILPHYGYHPKEIAIIESCILATRIPQTPTSHLAEIVCDADLDYLGRDDFHHISQKLRNEWINFELIGFDDKEWNNIQYEFLSQHIYFTKSANKLRNEQKQKHLNQIKNLI
ncbi:MAG: HD domain-containing protein [Cytophagales bacterium]